MNYTLPETIDMTQIPTSGGLLKDFIGWIFKRLLKSEIKTYNNVINSTEKYYVVLEGVGKNILFVTLVTFSDLKGGIISVGGINNVVWVLMPPQATLQSLTVRIWYI